MAEGHSGADPLITPAAGQPKERWDVEIFGKPVLCIPPEQNGLQGSYEQLAAYEESITALQDLLGAQIERMRELGCHENTGCDTERSEDMDLVRCLGAVAHLATKILAWGAHVQDLMSEGPEDGTV
ncbi:MAG: hypothetical protein Q9183_003939, partial [Haloplaca sp. 2 TL-2023]